MKGLLLFTIVLIATVSIEGHGNGWCRGPRSHLNRRFDIGYALDFDGSDFVELPSLSLGGALSFEFLLKADGTTGPIMSFGPPSNNIEISLTNQRKLVLTVTRPGNGNSITSTSVESDQIPVGWQYYVITVENNRRVIFYRDDDDSSPSEIRRGNLDFVPTWSARTPGYFGRSAKNLNSFFTGRLDDIRIWSRILSNNEIDRNRDIPDGDSSLIAWWNFNQGVGTVATDVSFQGRDGSLGGSNFSATPQWVVSQFVRSKSCKIYRDVSVKTFDRKCFRIRTSYVGDFWLVEGPDRDLLAIQVRIQNKPGSNQGTVVQQLAFQYAQTVYRWDLDFASKSDSLFYVNNSVITTVNFEDSFTGVSVYKSYTGNSRHVYDVNVGVAFRMKIEAFPRDLWTDITVRVPRYNEDLVSGLCGNWDGEGSNDEDPTDWPVLNGENFFSGPVNLTGNGEYSCELDSFPQLAADAIRICSNTSVIALSLSQQCLNDICVAQDISAAYSLAEATYQDCLDDGGNCRPPCPNFCSLRGVCQLNGVCTCSPPWTGADCSQQRTFPCYQASWGNKQRQINPFKGVKSAINEYSYSRNFPFSSGSGKEISDTTNLYLYQEAQTGFLSLIHLNDKARDDSGGRVRANYNFRSVPATNPTIKVSDDPSWIDDSYTSVTNGNFTANWVWWGCCTDGLVLELLRTDNLITTPNFCLTVNLTRFEGISQVVVSSENSFGSNDIVKLDNDRVNLCGTVCNNTCGTYSNCQTCTNDPNCGWCVETETCELGSSGGPQRGRCNLWRFSNRNNVARVVKTEVNYPVDPASATIYLPTGQTATADFFVFVPPPANLPLDIMLSLDVSKYFGNDLTYIQSSTAAVFASMSTFYPLSRLGITSFSDAPFQPLGSASQGDYAYLENLRLTSNIAFIQNTLNSLVPKDGGDAQNSQLTAMYNAARSSSLNWRLNAMKLLVVITKSDYHAPPTSLPNGATEYPTPAAVRDALLNANIVPIFIVPTSLQARYQSLITQFGFGYVRGLSTISSANIFNAVQETVTILSTSIKAIKLPSTAPNVNTIYPTEGYTGISAGTRVVFTATLSQSIAGGATVVVPGFGKVDFSFISSDLPQGASQSVVALNGQSSTIIQLYAFGYYGQAFPEITQLTNTSVARIFQVIDGVQKGPEITSVLSTLTDSSNKVWIQFQGTGTTTFNYQVKDDCRACSPSNYTVTISYQTSNRAPTATSPGLIQFPEDGSANITLSGTDPEDGISVTAIITSLPSAGTLFQANGSPINSANTVVTGNRVVFRSAPNQFGPAPTNLYSSFTFSVRDSQNLLSAPVLVSIFVTPVNDAPVVYSNSTSTNEDTPVAINLSGFDIEGDLLTFSIASLPNNGRLSRTASGPALLVGEVLNGTGVWFIPDTNWNGATSFTFRAFDGNLISTPPATITITVNPVNDPPFADSQEFRGDEDTDIPITLQANDFDSTALTAIICNWNGVGTLLQFNRDVITPGSNIIVTDPQRRLIYRPPTNAFSGSLPLTSFTFRITDGLLSTPQCLTASIIVNEVPDDPIAIAPSQVFTNESVPVSITLRGQDVDLVQVTFKICTGPAFGTLTSGALTLSTGSTFPGTFTPPDLTFANVVFAPVPSASGTPYDSFSFQTVYLGRNSSCVNVTINVAPVNNAPVASNGSLSTDEDIESQPYTLTANDIDTLDAQITFTITRKPSRGKLLLASDLSEIINVPAPVPSKQVIFVPRPNENGINYDSFDFQAFDGYLPSAIATVAVTVNAVNDPPVAYPFTLSFSDVNNYTIDQFSGYDVENGTNLSVKIESLPTSGTLYICQTAGDPNCNTVVATVGAIAPLNTVNFAPNQTLYNTYIVTFNYSVVDGENLASVPETVTLNVTKTNNPPVVTPVETPVITYLGLFTVLQVEASDPDVGQTVRVIVSPNGILGSLAQCVPDVNDNCTIGAPITTDDFVTDPSNRVLYFAPGTSGSRIGDVTLITFSAVDTFLLRRSTTIQVVVLNPTPAIISTCPTISFNEKQSPWSFTLSVNSTDTSIRFTVQTPPTLGYLTQGDGSNITSYPALVTNGGNLIYVKNDIFGNGLAYDSFTWTAASTTTSAALASPATTTVSVSPVNDSPQAILFTPPVFNEDSPGLLQLTAYDPDVATNGDNLTFTIVFPPNLGGAFFQVNSQNMSTGVRILDGQPVTSQYGLVWFVPPANYYSDPLRANIVFRYRVTDSQGLTDISNVQFFINPVNDVPMAFNSRYSGQNNQIVTTFTLNNWTDVEVFENNPNLQQTASVMLLSLPDPQRGILYVDAVLPANLAQLNVNYTTFIFKFETAQPGVFMDNYASFQWQITDGVDISNIATATIDIRYFNTPPTVVLPGASLSVEESGFVDFIVAARDPDLQDSVTLEFPILPTKGTLYYYNEDSFLFEPVFTSTVLQNSTTVRYVPTGELNGDDTFTTQARDYRNSSPLDISTVRPITTVNILPINNAPSLATLQTSLVSNGYGIAAISNGVTVTDDASENNGLILVSITSVGAERIRLTNPGAVTVTNTSITAFNLTGSVAQINAALASGVEFYPAVNQYTGTLSFFVDDRGQNDYRPNQPGLTDGPLDIAVNVDSSGTLELSAGFIGVTTLMSAGVFGAYKIMKKKKLIPEEADPWENDELFDMTLDNPLYSGSNPSSLEPVFDSK